MSLRTARTLAAGYFLLATVAFTWPGMTLVAQPRPFVLGLPLPLAWMAAWIVGAVFALYLLDRVERRHRED